MSTSKAVNLSPHYAGQLRRFAAVALVTMIAALCAAALLLPIGNSVMDALTMRRYDCGELLPVCTKTFTYHGQRYNIYYVPQPDGSVKQWALVNPRRNDSDFVDPSNPDAGLITWQGKWRELTQVPETYGVLYNFTYAWEHFGLVLRNTLMIALLGMGGTLLSSICVAYAFARFPIPGKNILFFALLASVIIPPQITSLPTYTLFTRIGWIGMWLPLIIPAFFANALAVFLLRQHFMALPRQLDEAAMMDGASPLQVLQVIIPQSWPVIIAVGLFYFIFAWNSYLTPLIYQLQTASVTLAYFNWGFWNWSRPGLVQAASLLVLVVPVFVFVLAYTFFMRAARIIKDSFSRGLWRQHVRTC